MAKKLSVPKDFQAGDIVLVECSGAAIRKSVKWKNTWTATMEGAVGKCLEVKRENTGYGVGLAFNDGIFGFPEKVLRLIKRGKKSYFQLGDKVLVARHAEGTYPEWDSDGLMDGAVGKVYEVDTLFGQTGNFQPAIHLKTETGRWFFSTDCVELYTGQTPDELPKPQPIVTLTVTEPLQAWERF